MAPSLYIEARAIRANKPGLTAALGRWQQAEKLNSGRHGHEGFVSFTAKTKLIAHYEKTLGAYHFGGHKMIIPTEAAQKLVDYYFKN